jgi:phage terminase small subunit
MAGTGKERSSTATGRAKHPYNPERPPSPRVKKALAEMDMEALEKALTPRQRLFCKEYIVDFHGAAAVIRAGYNTKNPDVIYKQLMMNPGITTFIEYLQASAAARIMSVDPDYVVQGIVKILQKETAKDGDKLRGYELLARVLGMFIDKQEITGKDGGPLEIEQRRIEEEEAQFIGMLQAMKKDKVKK